jgi:ATP-dependent RNA helicase RhlE
MSNHPSFYGLGIAPNILAVLDKLSFKTPTPIQAQSIPPALEGKDLMGLAQTGTGKTLAFGIPMVQATLAGKQGLIILPTRELALQVDETLGKVGGPLGLKTALLIGGGSMSQQIQALRRGPSIVIGTPGRMIDHLQQGTVTLKKVSILVLDEADRMLDMGFAPQLERILKEVPRERQTMLFSATMPDTIVKMANSYMKLPLRIEIAPPGKTADKVTQELFFISKMDKPRLLEKILREYRGSVLIFSRTKFGAKRIASGVRALGHTAAELHSNKSLNQRREALDGFKNGKYRVLCATDIAARGIDVKDIELVVNYDLPTNAEDYIHRIGRTARAGAAGHAISFATPDQKNDVRDIERLMRAALPQSHLADLPPPRSTPEPSSSGHRPHRPQGGSSRSGQGGPRRSSGGFRGRRRFGPRG